MTIETAEQQVVFVVDDDASVRESLRALFRSVGLCVDTFAKTSEFLNATCPDIARCLVLDVRLPGMSGLELQIELAKVGIEIPIIFITGHGDIPMAVRAMRNGAVEFLTKPFRDQDILEAVQSALELDCSRREAASAISVLRRNYDSLTAREQQIMEFVTAGLMNKQIAEDMGVSEITVKVHPRHAMKKMGAHSLAELVQMADRLGEFPVPSWPIVADRRSTDAAHNRSRDPTPVDRRWTLNAHGLQHRLAATRASVTEAGGGRLGLSQ